MPALLLLKSKLVKTALGKRMSKVISKYPEAEIRQSDPHSIRIDGHPWKGASASVFSVSSKSSERRPVRNI